MEEQKCKWIEMHRNPISLNQELANLIMIMTSRSVIVLYVLSTRNEQNHPVEINEQLHWFFADLTRSRDGS